jgi:hypothetical protein
MVDPNDQGATDGEEVDVVARLESMAAGLRRLATLARLPEARDSLPAFADRMQAIGDDAAELAAAIAETEAQADHDADGGAPAAPPLDWKAAKAAAHARTHPRFRRGQVRLEELANAVELLTRGACHHAEQQAASGAIDSERQSIVLAGRIAEAYELLCQTVARMKGFARAMAVAEAARPTRFPATWGMRAAMWGDGTSEAAKVQTRQAKDEAPEELRRHGRDALAMRFHALTGAANFARWSADIPGQPLEAMLHALVDECAGFTGRRASASQTHAFATARGLAIAAVAAWDEARAMGGRVSLAEAVNRVADAWSEPLAGSVQIRTWRRDAAPLLRAIKEGRSLPAGKITGRTAGMLETVLRHLAPGQPGQPMNREAWERIAEAMEAMLCHIARRPQPASDRGRRGITGVRNQPGDFRPMAARR